MRWCCGASSIAPAGPPTLTAEQLARKKEEAERIAAQLAEPSYWDGVGTWGPNASALKAALADTVLVDAAWLARLAKKRGVLPRCQDLPPGARVTLEEMEKWKHSGPLGVLVISYPWWAPLALDPSQIAPPASSLSDLHVTHALLPPLARTGSTPTTPTRTGCSCARSQRC
jgi:hypothetical protein